MNNENIRNLNSSDTDYKVGYRKPPVHTRFKPGQCGNPRGRPKKKDTDIVKLLFRELKQRIFVEENGKRIKVTKREVLVKQILKKAIMGDSKCLDFILRVFAELEWRTMSALEETFGTNGTLGRETRGEVVLVPRLRAALERLNPKLPPEAIISAVDELTRDRSAMPLVAANREVYSLIKDGITVSIPDRERGGQKTERLRVFDWEKPTANDFLLVSQFSVTGTLYTCRPDLVGFVNGLPLVVVELKKPGVPARSAFDDNLTHYKEQIPALLWFNALLIASNGTDSRVGSVTADWDTLMLKSLRLVSSELWALNRRFWPLLSRALVLLLTMANAQIAAIITIPIDPRLPDRARSAL